MFLYICNECPYKQKCDKAFKVGFEWFCDSNNPRIKKEQEDRFEKDHKDDFGWWMPQ